MAVNAPPPLEFALQIYDLAGNLSGLRECSSSNGTVTVWATNLWMFDGLNRLASETIATRAIGITFKQHRKWERHHARKETSAS